MGRISLAVLLALSLLAGCSKSSDTSGTTAATSGPSSSAPSQLTIAVIPKGTTHVYWKSVEAGANQAGKELGVDIRWKGPLKEDDAQGQINVVEEFVTEGVNGIVLAPLDDQALLRPVREADDAKIPVVIIDSPLKGTAGTDFVSLVATDNHRGGVMAGQELAKELDGKGKVVLLRYHEHSASTEAREAGFLEVMAQNPGITMLVQNRYGGATSDSSMKEAMNMLDQIREADGIFCPNESTTAGMLAALRDSALTKKAKFVGFDATPDLVKALQDGEINALVAQDPVHMGYLGVKTIVAAIRGEKVDQNVDTGEHLITPETLNTPEIQTLLAPPQ
jgi:ribose transport system substrate-binding protein